MCLERWIPLWGRASRAANDHVSLLELQLWAISMGVSSCLVDVEPYERCRVAGVIERLLVDPQTGCVEATVTDGTARLTARWTIASGPTRRGLACGRKVVLEGVALSDLEGETLLDEPALQIAPDLLA